MIPYNNLKTAGWQPYGRYTTTYSRDYQPFSEHYLQVPQPKSEAAVPRASINLPHPPPCFHFPASSSPFGILAPSIFKGRTQEVRVASDPRLLRREEEKGQLHCVCENALLQQNRKKELQQKIDGLCKKDTIVFSSHVDPACCEDFLRSLCREAELKHLPNLSSSSSPIITYKDAENCDNRDYLKGLTLASNLKDRAFFQSTSWQRSCREWEPEHQNSCCSGMQMCPSKLCQFRSLPPARVSPTIYCTEYQSNYAPKWSQSNTCMSYLHNCSPCH
ncbi:uncharacterized protein [Channa argus]|uniref:uncharacterized protein isoform X4 n=1 Tax=Channa argus TaxID=215402 RepID=UPI0035225025